MSQDHHEILEKISILIEAGKPHEILDLVNIYFQENPKTPILLSKLGTAHIMLGRRDDAEKLYGEALLLNSKFSPALANLALMSLENGDFLEAHKLAKQAYAIDPTNVPLYSTYANILKHLGLFDEAIKKLKQGLEHAPDHLDMQLNLAGMCVENSNKEQAYKILGSVLKTHPNNSRAHLMLSSIHKFSEDDCELTQLKDLLVENNLSKSEKIEIYFALGKAYEDCKDFEKSFLSYKSGNDLFRETYNYNVAQEKYLLDDIVEKSSNLNLGNHTEDYSPIFIVGMPRSGTSLIEQILASHPDVSAMGELATIERLYDQQETENFISLKRSRQVYLDIIQHRLNGRKIFTDKMPMNFRYIGFIKALFPNAKFIHCQRDPIDVCLSIYKKKFVGILPYAQNLAELTEYYKLYECQMKIWSDLFPNDIWHADYTDFVSDTENQIRQMLEFCNLPWNNECIDFYKNRRVVTTASAQQVRQPIYKDALSYWKNYAPWIEPLVKEFSVK